MSNYNRYVGKNGDFEILEQPKKSKGFTIDQKAAHWQAFDTKAVSAESEFKAAIEKLSAKQQTMFKAQYNAGITKGLSAGAAMDGAISFVFDRKMDVHTFNEMAGAWGKATREGGKLAAEMLSTAINFDLLNPTLMSWVKDHGLEMAKEINGTTAEYLAKMKKPIADLIESGGSIQKISAMLAGEFDKLSTTRAELIARTETMSSVNFGQFATYKAEGIEKKEWLATMDGRTRGSDPKDKTDHLGMNGQIVGIDEDFTDPRSGAKLAFPGDSKAGAASVCRCRCTILPVIKENE